jgi:WD40 repeat protein
MSQLIPSTKLLRTFGDHEEVVEAVAMFPGKGRMVVACGRILHLWDLKTGVVLKKIEGHRDQVLVLAVSRDGQLVASGDRNREIIVWHGETGGSLTQPIKVHTDKIISLDFYPDGEALATGSGPSADYTLIVNLLAEKAYGFHLAWVSFNESHSHNVSDKGWRPGLLGDMRELDFLPSAQAVLADTAGIRNGGQFLLPAGSNQAQWCHLQSPLSVKYVSCAIHLVVHVA